MSKQVQAYVCLTLAMVIVGSSVVVGKLVVSSFPVFLAAGLRFAVGTMVLLPLLWLREGVRLPKLARGEWLLLFLQAFAGAFLFTVFLFYGLKLTNAAEAGIITSTAPAVVGVLAFIFLREQLTLNKIIGITLAVGGVLLSTGAGSHANASQQASTWLGYLLVFGAVVGEASFTILRKSLPDAISPLFTATMMSLFSLLLFLPLAVVEGLRFDLTAVSLQEWLLIMYYGVVITAVAFILWFQGVTKVPGSTAAIFTGVAPISAVLLSYVILHESFQWAHVGGGLCVLAGIFFIVRKGNLRIVDKLAGSHFHKVFHKKHI
jgi:drug/metabolite transporter (DMT)-like permease